MNRDFYNEIKEGEFKNITFRLYNKIDEDYIPKILSKKYGEIFGIDDFEYYSLILDDREQFLLSMHNKNFLSNLTKVKVECEKKDCVFDIDFIKKEVNIIKLKKTEL